MGEKEEIPQDKARDLHDVATFHEQMENGELRFRLRKTREGSAYIRTEASAIGAWQKPHYHKYVQETYIVQDGWIAYAEWEDGHPSVRICRAGNLFTTRPTILHNVYMPARAVIHTVKHGQPPADDLDDRKTDHPDAAGFETWTSTLDTEAKILREGEKARGSGCPTKYSEEYRHFDTLIWQLPIWSTGLFTLALLGLDALAGSNLARLVPLETTTIAIGFIALMAFAIGSMGHALYRFRRHRATLKPYKPTPKWNSASFYLQLSVLLEAAALVYVALLITGWASTITLGGCILAVAVLSGLIEWDVGRHKPREGAAV